MLVPTISRLNPKSGGNPAKPSEENDERCTIVVICRNKMRFIRKLTI